MNILDATKENHKRYISDMCKQSIEDGFECDGYKYASDLEEQVNLIGAMSIGIDMPYKCTRISDGVKEFYFHTAAQIKNVVVVGSQIKIGFITKASMLKNAIDLANTVEEVEAVTW
jgi:hypothetical protein